MIPAVVLAAGASRRMGSPKALLQLGGRTFVLTVVEALTAAGITNIFVIVRDETHDAIAVALTDTPGARLVVNTRADDGQLSSLITGLDTADAPGVSGVLVTLVDVPLVMPATVRTLVARAGSSPSPILRVVHGGRHGHPVIYKREVFAALRAADPAVGAKAVMRSVGVEDIDVDDPGILQDFDTPEDYRSLLTRKHPTRK
jgi:molybdenum cofactor cytidylyltransferase